LPKAGIAPEISYSRKGLPDWAVQPISGNTREEVTMDFGIKSYQAYFFSIPADSHVIAPTATIFLYDTRDVYRGDLVFYRTPLPGEPSAGSNSYDPVSKTFRCLMDQSALGGVLSALELNVPCHIRGYDQPRPELRTGKAAAGYRSWPMRLVDAISGVISSARGPT
jgi:hypothetical protein